MTENGNSTEQIAKMNLNKEFVTIEQNQTTIEKNMYEPAIFTDEQRIEKN